VLYTHLYQASNTVMVACSWFFVLVASGVVLLVASRFLVLLLSRLAVPAREDKESFQVSTNGVRTYSSSALLVTSTPHDEAVL